MVSTLIRRIIIVLNFFLLSSIFLLNSYINRIRIVIAIGHLHSYPRHDNRVRGKRRYQEGTRDQYRGQPDWGKDWTGGRTKEELFSGSDRWHQEKHYDLRRRLYHPENRFKTEQGGGRRSVFTGSKDRACDREI